MRIHFNEFRGRPDHQHATFDQLRACIWELEGQLEQAQHITLGQQEALKATLARVESEKKEAIQEKAEAI